MLVALDVLVIDCYQMKFQSRELKLLLFPVCTKVALLNYIQMREFGLTKHTIKKPFAMLTNTIN